MNLLLLIAALLLQQAAPAQPGVIAGRVTYSDGTPYIRSPIVAQAASEGGQPLEGSMIYRALTSQTGDFRFANIPPGHYAIRTYGETPGDPGPTYPGGVTLSVASNVISLNFVLPAALTGFRVSGRVIRPSGQPNSRTNVIGSAESQIFSVPVAADGSFELLHVRAGSYSFTVNPSGGMQPVSVVVDRNISGLELVMPRLFEVAGTVAVEGRASLTGLFDARGGPSVSPRLRFDGPIPAAAVVLPNGTFGTSLIEGEYRILADLVPAGYYIKSLTNGERDLLRNRLEIAASDRPIELAMTLGASTGVKVSGNVTGLIGETSARVMIAGTVANSTFDAAINSDGSFTLAKVLPGVYTARVVMPSAVSSPPVIIAIPNKDVADLAIAVPAPKDISGRVTVEGNGPPPKFTLYMAHGFGPDWNPAPGDAAFEGLKRNAVGGGLQLLQIDVDALPDGSFKMRLPEGDYRIATQRSGIPSPYVLRSLTYGAANLLTETLAISDKESSELQVGFGTTSPNPWSSVRGRVIGFDPGTGPFRVALEGNATSAIETAVNPDGTFEFTRVLQNSTYTAKVRPENKMASSPRVSVADKDVGKVDIVVPRAREISGRAVVEGGSPAPNFMLSLTAPSSIFTVLVKPDSVGAFRITLPEDDRDVNITSLPFGYTLKSLSFGLTDLRSCVRGTPPRCSYPPLKIAGEPTSEIQVTFTVDPAMIFGKISGRVSGLNSDVGEVRLVLSDAASFNTFEESIGADGSFSFRNLPQGTYVPSLTGSVRSGLLNPSLINVEGDETGVRIEFPSGSAKRDVAASADPPAGARISEIGATNGVAGREAAAVATLRTINTAEVTYLATSGGKYGSLPQMIEVGLLPSNFTGPVSGFRFGVIRDASNSDFVIAAIPDASGAASGVARYAFYVLPDGTVRYSTIDSLAPAGQNGTPVQ